MSLKCAGSRWHGLKAHCSIPAAPTAYCSHLRPKHQQQLCFIYELFINFIELINVFNSFFRAVITRKRSNTPTKQQKFSPHHPSVTNKKKRNTRDSNLVVGQAAEEGTFHLLGAKVEEEQLLVLVHHPLILDILADLAQERDSPKCGIAHGHQVERRSGCFIIWAYITF